MSTTPSTTRPVRPDRSPQPPAYDAAGTLPTPATPTTPGGPNAPSPADGDAVLAERSVTQRISDAIVKTYTTRYGKGPEAIRVHLNGETITAILRGGFTIVEEELSASGQAETVRDQRRAFGDMITPALRAAVAEVIGRDVVAVLADTHQHPDLTAIVLILASRSA